MATLTVTGMTADWPIPVSFTVMFALPSATAETRPVESTVAMDLLSELQISVVGITSTTLPALSFGVQVILCGRPAGR